MNINHKKNMTNRIKFTFLAGLVLALVALSTRTASALTLSPPSLEYSTEAGDTITSKVKLFNNTTDVLNLTTSTANFGARGEGGEPDFKFDTPSADLAAWIKISQDTVDLQPGETAEVPFTISIPADAEPGGHYAGVFFGTGGGTGEAGQVKLQSKLGALVIVRVGGNLREEAAVAEFGVSTKQLNRLPVELFMRVENSGNVHIRPSGTATIRNMIGGVSATIQVNPKDGAVLPNSIRRFDFAWVKNESTAKRGNFFSELGAEWRNFAMGNYTADVSFSYGESKKVASSTIHFSIFPWRALLVLVLGIVVVVLLLVMVIKRYNAMIISKAQSGTPRNSGSSGSK